MKLLWIFSENIKKFNKLKVLVQIKKDQPDVTNSEM